jgi:hypothetical protein
MGDNLGVKVSCGGWPAEPQAEGNCEGVNLGGEEAGEQNLDGMNKNCVARHRVREELAGDREVQKGSKQPYVNAARVRGKISNLIRGDRSLSGGQKSAEAIIVDGVTTIQGGQGNLARPGQK